MPRVSERGYRRATHAIRAYEDEWEMIQRFAELMRKDMAVAAQIFDIGGQAPNGINPTKEMRDAIAKEHEKGIEEFTALRNFCKMKAVNFDEYLKFLIATNLQNLKTE